MKYIKDNNEDKSFNIEVLIAMLNSAIADEWLAYFQYWVGSKLVKGKLRPHIQEELKEHAEEELEHAEMLVERVLQLKGDIVKDFEALINISEAGFTQPEPCDSINILEQNVNSEKKAIEVYINILNYIGDNDIVTRMVIEDILQDEEKHRQDLEDILIDIENGA